jgi:hypothetical protein
LESYLPTDEEEKKVEKALESVIFPSWAVNWDCELGSTEDGDSAVWVDVFAEETTPRSEYGRFGSQIIPKIRQAFSKEGVQRWPYVRLHTATEHKRTSPNGAP